MIFIVALVAHAAGITGAAARKLKFRFAHTGAAAPIIIARTAALLILAVALSAGSRNIAGSGTRILVRTVADTAAAVPVGTAHTVAGRIFAVARTAAAARNISTAARILISRIAAAAGTVPTCPVGTFAALIHTAAGRPRTAGIGAAGAAVFILGTAIFRRSVALVFQMQHTPHISRRSLVGAAAAVGSGLPGFRSAALRRSPMISGLKSLSAGRCQTLRNLGTVRLQDRGHFAAGR